MTDQPTTAVGISELRFTTTLREERSPVAFDVSKLTDFSASTPARLAVEMWNPGREALTVRTGPPGPPFSTMNGYTMDPHDDSRLVLLPDEDPYGYDDYDAVRLDAPVDGVWRVDGEDEVTWVDPGITEPVEPGECFRTEYSVLAAIDATEYPEGDVRFEQRIPVDYGVPPTPPGAPDATVEVELSVSLSPER